MSLSGSGSKQNNFGCSFSSNFFYRGGKSNTIDIFFPKTNVHKGNSIPEAPGEYMEFKLFSKDVIRFYLREFLMICEAEKFKFKYNWNAAKYDVWNRLQDMKKNNQLKLVNNTKVGDGNEKFNEILDLLKQNTDTNTLYNEKNESDRLTYGLVKKVDELLFTLENDPTKAGELLNNLEQKIKKSTKVSVIRDQKLNFFRDLVDAYYECIQQKIPKAIKVPYSLCRWEGMPVLIEAGYFFGNKIALIKDADKALQLEEENKYLSEENLKIRNELDILKKKMQEIQNPSGGGVSQEEYDKLKNQYDELMKEMQEIQNPSGGVVPQGEYDKLRQYYESAIGELDILKKKMQEMQNPSGGVVPQGEYDKLRQDYDNVCKKCSNLQTSSNAYMLKNGELQDELEKLKNDYSVLLEENDNLLRQLKKKDEENYKLNQDNFLLNKENQDLFNRVKCLEGYNEELFKYYFNFMCKTADNLAECISSYGSVLYDINSLDYKNSDKMEALNLLKEVEDCKNRYEQSDNSISNMLDYIDSLWKYLKFLSRYAQKNYDKYKNIVESHQQEIDNLEKDKELLNKKLKKLKARPLAYNTGSLYNDNFRNQGNSENQTKYLDNIAAVNEPTPEEKKYEEISNKYNYIYYSNKNTGRLPLGTDAYSKKYGKYY